MGREFSVIIKTIKQLKYLIRLITGPSNIFSFLIPLNSTLFLENLLPWKLSGRNPENATVAGMTGRPFNRKKPWAGPFWGGAHVHPLDSFVCYSDVVVTLKIWVLKRMKSHSLSELKTTWYQSNVLSWVFSIPIEIKLHMPQLNLELNPSALS